MDGVEQLIVPPLWTTHADHQAEERMDGWMDEQVNQLQLSGARKWLSGIGLEIGVTKTVALSPEESHREVVDGFSNHVYIFSEI